jgi:hypothetical protein
MFYNSCEIQKLKQQITRLLSESKDENMATLEELEKILSGDEGRSIQKQAAKSHPSDHERICFALSQLQSMNESD